MQPLPQLARRLGHLVLLCCVVLVAAVAARADGETWRYYRVGNTGIQGDYNDAVWIGPDGDPYVGGYNPSFEEGGFAHFLQAENRWVNFSNVDYPVIGHPDSTGTSRVSDFAPDAAGRLWMATGRGALFFDPAVGASSLVRYDRNNSALPGGWNTDVDIAPDGTVWFVAYSTVWGAGGVTRYTPSTNSWTRWNLGGSYISVQPKPGGGYLVWTASSYYGYAWRFNSTTGAWTQLPFTGAPGQVAGMPGKDCVDDQGNFWALRLRQPGAWEGLDYLTTAGTWVSPPAPFDGVTYDIWAFKAFGDKQALLVDGNSTVWRFDGTAWTNLGIWRSGAWTESIDIDAAGVIWISGTGGAARRDPVTGAWQRYRITNTAQFDDFSHDITIDQATGAVYAGANAGAGIGGMVRFDGTRWTGWNSDTYGLGYDWPFLNDNCEALTTRPSNGRLVVSPASYSYGIHEWDGTHFTQLSTLSGAVRLNEDSGGRVWALGEYYALNYFTGSAWSSVPMSGWGSLMRPDPSRANTVWTITGNQVQRTDGAYRFQRQIGDFPELATISDQFSGLAPDANGVVWIGASVQRGQGGTGGALIKLDATTGAYTMWRYDQGWPFPGHYVTPWAVTSDGRLWMQYDTDYPYTERGLCWWDGTHVGSFPAPPGGTPQWGGLPHGQIEDVEVKPVSDGYELWMSCVSRGIAVLHVPSGLPVRVEEPSGRPALALALTGATPAPTVATFAFALPRAGRARLTIANVRGRVVRVLRDGSEGAGAQTATWDLRDGAGAGVASGVYIARLEHAGAVMQRRIVVTR